MTTTAIDQGRLEEFMGRVVSDAATTIHAATVILGEKLGLYKALAEQAATAAELAARTGLDERYLEEWGNAQVAAGYCSLVDGRYVLSPEAGEVLANEESPAYATALFTVASVAIKDEETLVRRALSSGDGVGWHEHHPDLFGGTERLFKPGYVANLTESWIPALDGVADKLAAGASVADIGCGYGASAIVLARAYPNSTYVGFDNHAESIDVARKRAAEAGVSDRVRFEVAAAADYPGSEYDLVCAFDSLHDMGDPVAAAAHVRQSLAADGTFLMVEPMAGESVEENCNFLGKLFYSAGLFLCVPNAKSQGGRYELGPLVPQATWQELLSVAGFTRFRRAAETPFNRVFEARP
jgi:SAM-dependent methyltransferase